MSTCYDVVTGHYRPMPQPTVTLSDIDAATTDDERISLIQTCIEEENRASMSTSGPYWAVSEPLDSDPSHTLSENLIWETMHPTSPKRPTFHHRLFQINVDRKFCGYIDIETQCRGIRRHDIRYSPHKCINRTPDCFDIDLDVISYTLHPMSDYFYIRDLDLFHRKSDQSYLDDMGPFQKMTYRSLTMVYSYAYQTGRVILTGAHHCYVPPYLAKTDGLIPNSVLNILASSQITIPDITAITSDQIIIADTHIPAITSQ